MTYDRETDEEWMTDEEFEMDARHRLRAQSSGANDHVEIKQNGPRFPQRLNVQSNGPLSDIQVANAPLFKTNEEQIIHHMEKMEKEFLDRVEKLEEKFLHQNEQMGKEFLHRVEKLEEKFLHQNEQMRKEFLHQNDKIEKHISALNENVKNSNEILTKLLDVVISLTSPSVNQSTVKNSMV